MEGWQGGACPQWGPTCDDLLPGPCPQDGCPNITCSGELVFHACAPCPLTCDDISGQAVCPPDRPCGGPGKGALALGCWGPVCLAELSAGRPHAGPPSGCWCPAGQVLGAQGQCVWPRQCPCLVDGSRYWPGQRVKTDCQLCVCQDGRPRRCRPSPDCTGEPHPALPEGLWSPPDHPASPSPDSCPPPQPPVNCGWSAWSPWAECLGPCGSRSVQWSFRSPNNPRPAGRGHQCRGLHRKARRYRTPGTAPPAPSWEAACVRPSSLKVLPWARPQMRTTPPFCASISLNTGTPSTSLGTPDLLHQFYAQ